jgi:hypothetical protein
MDNGNEAAIPGVKRWLEEPARSSPWQRSQDLLRDLWLTVWRGRPEDRYAARTLERMAAGKLRDTIGLTVRNEEHTRAQAERWLAELCSLGLRPEHLCVEYGCGSLWCAEPVIRYMDSGRFIGLDVTDAFYDFGRQRLGQLLEEKAVRLDVISTRTVTEAAALEPDFVFSHRVLHHVPLRGLARYVRSVCALVGRRTVLVIEHRPRPLRGTSIKAPRYTVADIRRHLPRDLKCEAYDFGFVVTRRSD